MRKPGFLSIGLVVALGGLSFTIPAEDLSETVYDESEPLPWESVAAFSMTVPETAAEPSADRPTASLPRAVCLRKLGAHFLSHGTGLCHPMFDSLPILDHSLRC